MNKRLVAARWLLILLILFSVIVLVQTSRDIWHAKQVNRYIANPDSIEAVPEDVAAKLAFSASLIHQEKQTEALEVLTKLLETDDKTQLPIVFYNRGNINLRKALTMTDSDGRRIPLVELAKQDYRSALVISPDFWEARYNLELALRLVSEDPDEDTFEKKVINEQVSIESKAFKVDLP